MEIDIKTKSIFDQSEFVITNKIIVLKNNKQKKV